MSMLSSGMRSESQSTGGVKLGLPQGASFHFLSLAPAVVRRVVACRGRAVVDLGEGLDQKREPTPPFPRA
jgi:hypothetical protein